MTYKPKMVTVSTTLMGLTLLCFVLNWCPSIWLASLKYVIAVSFR